MRSRQTFQFAQHSGVSASMSIRPLFFLGFALFATVQASPVLVNQSPIKLPITRHINFTGTSLAKHDQARARFLQTRPKPDFNENGDRANAGAISDGVTNGAVRYTAQVGHRKAQHSCTAHSILSIR